MIVQPQAKFIPARYVGERRAPEFLTWETATLGVSPGLITPPFNRIGTAPDVTYRPEYGGESALSPALNGYSIGTAFRFRLSPELRGGFSSGGVLGVRPQITGTVLNVSWTGGTLGLSPGLSGGFMAGGVLGNRPNLSVPVSWTFAVQPDLAVRLLLQAAAASQAWVTNLTIGETTRWVGLPFLHIVRLGGDYYGVAANGFYRIGGANDAGTPIAATVWTNPTDFGPTQPNQPDISMHKKRVPYLYAGTAENIDVTPYVSDGDTERSAGKLRSEHGAKRVTLPKGPIGRYWSFKIENVAGRPLKLDGLAPLIDVLKRKV